MVARQIGNMAGNSVAGPVGGAVAGEISQTAANVAAYVPRQIGRAIMRNKLLSFGMTTTLIASGLTVADNVLDGPRVDMSASQGHSDIVSEKVYLTDSCNGTMTSVTNDASLTKSVDIDLPLTVLGTYGPTKTVTKTKKRTGSYSFDTDFCYHEDEVDVAYNTATKRGTITIPGSAFYLKMALTPGVMPVTHEDDNYLQVIADLINNGLDAQVRTISLGHWVLNKGTDPNSVMDNMIYQNTTVGVANTCAPIAWNDMKVAFGKQIIATMVNDPTRKWNQDGNHATADQFTFNPTGDMNFKSPYEDGLNKQVASYKKAGYNFTMPNDATCKSKVTEVTTVAVSNAAPAAVNKDGK